MDGNRGDLGLLVVGAGTLGRLCAAAAVAARGTRLAGVVDCDEQAAIITAARLGVPAALDLESGLALPGVEAVVIATPHADHADQVREALEAGKHVLCEKPLTVDPDDARSLSRLADRLRLRLATGFNHRFYPPVRDALRLVGSWGIGRVESVRARIGHRASASFLKGWHTDVRRSGGGTLMDNGPHACDLVRRFLGEVVAAEGYVHNTLGLPEGCESEAFALFRDHDRGVAEVTSSWTQDEGYLSIEINGSDGHLHLDTAPWRLRGRLVDGRVIDRHYFGERLRERLFQLRHGCERSLVDELESFAAFDGERRVACATGWDGCRATEMIAAVYEAAEICREVPLHPLPTRVPARVTRFGRLVAHADQSESIPHRPDFTF